MKRKTPKTPPPVANTGSEPIPPGATRQAFYRPEDDEHAPGSAGGSRHAANDPGSPDEEYDAVDSNEPLAEPPTDEQADEPPYADGSGHPAEGSPAANR